MSDVAIAPPGPILEFRRNFTTSRNGVIGFVLVVLLVFAAVLAPLLALHPPDEQVRTAILHPPTWFRAFRWERTIWDVTCSRGCCMAHDCRCRSAPWW